MLLIPIIELFLFLRSWFLAILINREVSVFSTISRPVSGSHEVFKYLGKEWSVVNRIHWIKIRPVKFSCRQMNGVGMIRLEDLIKLFACESKTCCLTDTVLEEDEVEDEAVKFFRKSEEN